MKYELINDEVAKKLFKYGNTGKEFTARIVSSILNLDEKKVYDNLKFLGEEVSSNINIVDSKTDVLYETDSIIINIEINKSEGYKRLKNKNESYLWQLELRQLLNSKDYTKLKPLVQINIDNFDKFGKDDFIYHSKMMETKYNIVESENINIYHINLDYLRHRSYDDIQENKLAKSLYLFVCSDNDKLNDLYEEDAIMKEVLRNTNILVSDFDKILYYDRDELEKLDQQDWLEEGKKQGIEQGTNQRNVEIAKNMLSMNLTIEQISQATNLSLEEIKKLKEEI